MAKIIRKHKEEFVYLLFWLFVYLVPLLTMYIRTQHHSDEVFDWDEVIHFWGFITAFFVVFLIHNFLLAPLAIYKRRRSLYLCLCAVVVMAFGAYLYVNRPIRPRHKPRIERVDRQQLRHHHPPFIFGQPDLVSMFVVVLMMGMNVGVKLLFKQDEDQKKMQQLQNKNLKQQLEYLKYQINPHFFMNTLNNIHALVDIDPEEAKESIIELSKLMRYVLYDANKAMVSIQKESTFIDNYIELMRLRYADSVDIRVDRDGAFPDVMIAPLITITYVENAFKHGISYQQKSFIHIAAHVFGGYLHFECVNSKHPESTDDHGGVGLENTRKRLDLIYGDRYKLDIDDGKDEYRV